MTDDDYVRVTHRVPEHVRDAAQQNTEHGDLSELVRSLYGRIAFGDAEGGAESIEIELERVRAEKDDLRQQIRELQNELQTVEQAETRLEEKLSTHRSREDKYEAHLEGLEASLYDGQHVDPTHPLVKKAASAMNVEPDDVIAELQDRNPAIPEYAFQPLREVDQRWTGVDGE